MKIRPIGSAFFDVDGVLVDSLEAHLDYCARKARTFRLAIRLPTSDQLRNEIASGTRVSPMSFFFRAVGFPPKYTEIAVRHYATEFAQIYKLRLFPGVREMLSAAASSGLTLGIATSNVYANVSSALGDVLELFAKNCVFTGDGNLTKTHALERGIKRLSTSAERLIFVGDQVADFEAANWAGTQFLGVTYGWGIRPSDSRFPTADSPAEIGALLIRASDKSRSRVARQS